MIALLLLLFSAGTAEAGNFGITTGLDLGIWKSTFTQQAFGLKTAISGQPGYAFSPNFGFLFGPYVFVEYAPYLYTSSTPTRSAGATGASNEVDAFSLVAFNGGLIVPVVPVEVYSGIAYGNYGFKYGSNNDYSGYLLKAGITYRLGLGASTNLKLKFECQRHFITQDDSGLIPASINTAANLYVLTIGFNFSKRFGRQPVDSVAPRTGG